MCFYVFSTLPSLRRRYKYFGHVIKRKAQFVDVININNDHVYDVNNNKFGV